MKIRERFRRLTPWNKLSVLGALASMIALIVVLWPEEPPEGPASVQEVLVENAPGATVFQAGRDILLAEGNSVSATIRSLTIEARLTCSLETGAELPPTEVRFIPVGDSHSYLEGPAGRVRLDFVSPVHFRTVGTDRLTILNRFSLTPGTFLEQRLIQALGSFETLSVPIVTIVYGSALDRIQLLEVTIELNGKSLWHGSWEYDQEFQTGPRFSVPLQGLREKLEAF